MRFSGLLALLKVSIPPELALTLQSKGEGNLFAQLHRGQKLPGFARRRLSNKDIKTSNNKNLFEDFFCPGAEVITVQNNVTARHV